MVETNESLKRLLVGCQATYLELMALNAAHQMLPQQAEDGTWVNMLTSGNFELRNRYQRNDAGRTLGVMFMTECGSPVWHLRYRGCYPDTLMPFLMRAREVAWRHRDFIGGWGPTEYIEDRRITYRNDVRDGSAFERFGGHESVVDAQTGQRGFQYYAGGAVVVVGEARHKLLVV